MPKLVAALLAAVLAALALAACGGDDSTTSDSTSSGSASPPTSAQPSREERQAKQKGEEAKSGQSKSDDSAQSGDSAEESPSAAAKRAAAAVPPLKVSGGGSAKYRVKGGDNSIQEFGEESDEAELREAAEALHGFYVTRAEERWDAACSYLTAQLVEQFEAFASRAPKLKGADCGEFLKAFTRPLPPSIVREITRVDAVSLRREGDRAFLLYRGDEGTLYAMPMGQEDGAWKVGSVAPTPVN
jgi:hypothetical protein